MTIEFISYSGEYPNLCSGELKLRINGKVKAFGVDYDKYTTLEDIEKISKRNYPKFWKSGGCIKSTKNYSDMWAETAPWELVDESLPKYLKKYGQQLIDIFNANVRYGCCGGCI